MEAVVNFKFYIIRSIVLLYPEDALAKAFVQTQLDLAIWQFHPNSEGVEYVFIDIRYWPEIRLAIEESGMTVEEL